MLKDTKNQTSSASDSTSKTKVTLQVPKGMHDILPLDQPYWDKVRKTIRELADFYNFNRIETPILEHARLFEKSLGEDTDVIEKEMYIVKTKGGDTLALRPEWTSSVLRSYFENGLSRMGQPQRLWYDGPVFRHESPQQGRFRQFNQAGFEIIGGGNDPIYDAQIIIICQHLLKELKIKNTTLKINSIGCKVCRPIYKKQLVNYYRGVEKDLCVDCKRRLKINPLRLLDCKQAGCQKFKNEAPNILDKLCVTCSNHFKGVLEYLDEVNIPYVLSNQLVRGLDYYSRTVFEFSVSIPKVDLGALIAGGRYDYLAEMLGVKQTPAVGVASGMERLIAAMKALEVKIPPKTEKKIFVAHAGDLAKKKALKIIEELQSSGIATTESLARESLGAQLKVANKEGIQLAVIIGQREIYEESVILRDLKGGLQETFPMAKVADEIKKRLKA